MYTLLPMNQADADVRVFPAEVGGEMFGAVDRAVLAAGAAEADHQAGEAAAGVCLDMRINDSIDMFQEAEDFAIVLKEADDRLVSACPLLVWLISARVMDGSAVEDVTAPVARRVLRYAFPE